MASEDYTWEREAQFLGFTPVAFCDGIINAVNDYLFDGIDGVQSGFLKDGAMSEETVRAGCNRLLSKLQDATDARFDLFELYVLNNIFRIPASVCVPGDEPLWAATACSGGEEACARKEQELDAEIVQLRRQLRAERYIERKNKAELAVLEKAVATGGKILSLHKAAEAHAKHESVYPLGEHVSFLCEQAEELKGLLAGTLKRKAATMDSSSSSGEVSAADVSLWDVRRKAVRVEGVKDLLTKLNGSA